MRKIKRGWHVETLRNGQWTFAEECVDISEAMRWMRYFEQAGYRTQIVEVRI